MEEKKKNNLHTPSTTTVTSAMVVMMMMVMLLLIVTPATLACGGPALKDRRRGCKDCIVDQMKYGCPSCVPIIRCMARCLWGGTARRKCVQKCDCGGGKPRLSDCKKCMGRCKCNCVS